MARKTPIEDVYSAFLSKIEDPELASLDNDEYEEALGLWLNAAISMMELDGVELEVDYTNFNLEAGEFRVVLSRKEIEIISLYMVCSWYDAKINGVENINMIFAANGEKWSDQAKHLDSLKRSREDYYIRATHLVRNYSYKAGGYFK